ncbi:hypothetical protein SADUNF_Sadunf05G0097800 [Salix dunnii]|uniref:Uncharacterized protein n=1 Tax=Salix dunnii TaxID=1413687 RepID=A0A835K4H6_9ROSI|nr:hypothetical protein SADUNF_Sadunf05G0097800 [Salix dunnii]
MEEIARLLAQSKANPLFVGGKGNGKTSTAKIMCYRVECKQCKKYSWGGCGNHLATLYASIDKGKHCMCKSWPGVVVPAAETATVQAPCGVLPTSATTTACESQFLK